MRSRCGPWPTGRLAACDHLLPACSPWRCSGRSPALCPVRHPAPLPRRPVRCRVRPRSAATVSRRDAAGNYRAPVAGALRVLRGFTPAARQATRPAIWESTWPIPAGLVLAAGTGMVRFAGPVAGRGVVVISHPDGISTEYEPVTADVASGSTGAAGPADRTAHRPASGMPRCRLPALGRSARVGLPGPAELAATARAGPAAALGRDRTAVPDGRRGCGPPGLIRRADGPG